MNWRRIWYQGRGGEHRRDRLELWIATNLMIDILQHLLGEVWSARYILEILLIVGSSTKQFGGDQVGTEGIVEFFQTNHGSPPAAQIGGNGITGLILLRKILDTSEGGVIGASIF